MEGCIAEYKKNFPKAVSYRHTAVHKAFTLGLFRHLLRLSQKLVDPDIQYFTLARTRELFRRHQLEQSPKNIRRQLKEAQKNEMRLLQAVNGSVESMSLLKSYATGERGRLLHIRRVLELQDKQTPSRLSPFLSDIRSRRQRRFGPLHCIPPPTSLISPALIRLKNERLKQAIDQKIQLSLSYKKDGLYSRQAFPHLKLAFPHLNADKSVSGKPRTFVDHRDVLTWKGKFYIYRLGRLLNLHRVEIRGIMNFFRVRGFPQSHAFGTAIKRMLRRKSTRDVAQ